MKTFIKISILIFAFAACEKEKSQDDDITLKSGELLVGFWLNPQYNDTIVIYTRSDNLDEDGYSLSFDSENKFVERKNAGSCGTPPITYANFEGTWEQKDDSIINITTGYWGGTVDYQWKILELNKHTLKIAWLKQDYHNDF